MNRFRPCLLIHHRHLHQLQNAAPLCSHLKSRSVIRFSGPDTIKFLQGLLSNDVRRFGESPHEDNSPVVPPMYAALLTPQGRFRMTFSCIDNPGRRRSRTGMGRWRFWPMLMGRSWMSCWLFLRYTGCGLKLILRMWQKTSIAGRGMVGVCLKNTPSVEEPVAPSVGWTGGDDRSGNSASHGNGVGWQWFKDPRLDCLGFRGIFPSGTTPPLVESDKETDEEKYLLWRLEKGVAEGSTEIPKGLNAISFDKGCYVGQELI
ncbi:hypothetical protein ERO13_A03G011900v2 [Gossypium hirsutum]|nr:hypothetical protein ERO13_A03G011900v2 [Gossypium hirsutum]